MSETFNMPDRSTLIIRRIARIWSSIIMGIGILGFIAELIEAFTTELGPYPFYENLIPLTLVTGIIGLAVAWRWEVAGSLIAILSVVINLVTYLFTGREAVGIVILVLMPIFIPAVLFLVCAVRLQNVQPRTS